MNRLWYLPFLLLLSACTYDKLEDSMHGYPEDIASVFRTSCANAGCHTATSSEAAAGLNMETWASLFEGSRGGSPVIPYSPDQSYLLYSINTDTSRGVTLSPTMPIGGSHLSDDEYNRIRQWILEGARNAKGEERFPAKADRIKWYIGNQGCDLVSVFDAESKQVMRYVQVGNVPGLSESPHMIKISKDKKYWYVVFLAANPHIEKYSTLNDEKVADIYIGSGDWNTFNISPDGKFGFAVAYNGQAVAIVDLEKDTLATPLLAFQDKIHGAAIHPNQQKLYITLQDGSGLYVLDYDNNGDILNFEPVDLIQTIQPTIAGPLWPHELAFTPDGSKYFVSCQHSNEVRVFETANNTILAVIPVGDDPTEFARDDEAGHLFVTCTEDLSTFAGQSDKRGSVAVIDYNSNTLVKSIYVGYQPHGLDIDPVNGYLVVANRNNSPGGPAPHHSSNCGVRNGYLALVNLQTLEVVSGFKPELSDDPYTVAVKR